MLTRHCMKFHALRMFFRIRFVTSMRISTHFSRGISTYYVLIERFLSAAEPAPKRRLSSAHANLSPFLQSCVVPHGDIGMSRIFAKLKAKIADSATLLLANYLIRC